MKPAKPAPPPQEGLRLGVHIASVADASLREDLAKLRVQLAATAGDVLVEQFPHENPNPAIYESVLWDPRGAEKYPAFATFPKAFREIPMAFAKSVTACWGP